MTIVTSSKSSLRFRPRAVALPEAPGPWPVAWQAQVAPPRALPRLVDLDESVLLLNAPSGVTEAWSSLAPGPERVLAHGGPVNAYPSVDGGPIFLNHDSDEVYRWEPKSSPELLWNTRVPGREAGALGLAGGDVLVWHPRPNSLARGLLRAVGGEHVLQRIHPASRSVVWQASIRPSQVVPAGDAIYVVEHGKTPRLMAFAAETGDPLWKRPAGGMFTRIVAVLDQHLWCHTRDDQLVAFRTQTGDEAVRVASKFAPRRSIPAGLVDERGWYHTVVRRLVQVFDLTARGAQVVGWEADVIGTPDSIGTVHSDSGIVTADGRFLFSDWYEDRNHVFACSYPQGKSPRLEMLWHSKPPIVDLRATGGSLLVLTQDGTLTCLRPSAAR